MSELQDRLASIQGRISSAAQEEARNDVLRERAEAEYQDALNTLKEEFGVSDLEEAENLRRELEKQLQDSVDSVEKSLDALGA